MSERVFIIAEAGVNHNGSLQTAKNLIDIAKESGADAVKFQTYVADKVISRHAPKAEYQQALTGTQETQLEMAQKLQLTEEDHKSLIAHCAEKKIQFLSTPFDCESIDLLNRLELDIFKIPSGEITNLPYLKRLGALHKRIILSTGMSTLEEINTAIEVLVAEGTLRSNITVLHCNTQYPTPLEDVNLRAMQTIKETLDVEVGYSDHTLGINVPIAAVAMGAVMIEKHFTLDKDMQGPDHKASLNPEELARMVIEIRDIEKTLGTGVKEPSPSEVDNMAIARKSIVAALDIEKGDTFTDQNITTKRPGTGISPMQWEQVIGKKAQRSFNADELIEL